MTESSCVGGVSVFDCPVRVLLTTPDSSKAGGVARYFNAVRPHLSGNVQYLTVGSRSNNGRMDIAALRVLRDAWRFARVLRHGGHEIVHLNPSIYPKALLRDALLLVIAKALHRIVVVFAHGWDTACERVLLKQLSSLFRLFYGRADAFIVLGEDFKNRLRRLGYKKRVFVRSAPIDDELLHNCAQHPLRRRTAERDKFNILFLARVEKEKGIYEALEAYRLLKEKHPFVSLTVAGDGSELSGAVQAVSARHLADVSFTGYVEATAKHQVFRSADAYFFPSHTEGLPLSVLEAMAYGLPIVTRTVGGLPDFFRDGEMGFLTESWEPEVLASLLDRLICDAGLYSRISLFNYTYARNHFTSSQIARSLAEVYLSLLGTAERTDSLRPCAPIELTDLR
jgi:glycosyltransferase involved in cell wall biosynthesis